MKFIKPKYILRIVFPLLLLMPFLIIGLYEYIALDEQGDDVPRVNVIIPKGASLNAIADSLLRKNLIDDRKMFRFWVTTLELDRQLKAGYYEVPTGLTYPQLVKFLTTARSKQIKVTLIEGWRIEQIAEALSENLDLDKSFLISLAHDPEFITELGIQAETLEGYLLPDTYFFYWGMEEKQLIRFLVSKCLEVFDEPAQKRLQELKMSRHEIITLASIIEGEAILDSERDTISSVYHNRLKKRIKLQADPTIQYILAGPPRRLLYKDLEIDSPYNTYKYYGLPPGPINNPGKNSILAAIYPADTRYIYFVARGDGGHTFSRTAAEHARAKQKFNRIRREVYRKKKLSNQ